MMRTTVTLDNELERILREKALRSGLENQAGTMAAEPFVVRARPMGLRTGLDPAAFNRLADDLEAEAFMETTRKLIERES